MYIMLAAQQRFITIAISLKARKILAKSGLGSLETVLRRLCQAEGLVNLWTGQAHAISRPHRLDHVLYQLLQFLIELGDWPRLLSQYWIVKCLDIQQSHKILLWY